MHEYARRMVSMIQSEELRNIMMNASRIVAVSPHPDDTELIAGGYLSLMAQRGADILLIVATDGSKGTRTEGLDMTETRKKEQMNAAAILGIKKVVFLGFKDTESPDPRVLRESLLPAMREFIPDIVITVDPFLEYEVHPDHVNVGLATLQSVLFYPLPNIGGGKAGNNEIYAAVSPTNRFNVIVDIETSFEKKIDALKAHASQSLDLEEIRRISSLVGSINGYRFGEAFRVLRRTDLHIHLSEEYFKMV